MYFLKHLLSNFTPNFPDLKYRQQNTVSIEDNTGYPHEININSQANFIEESSHECNSVFETILLFPYLVDQVFSIRNETLDLKYVLWTLKLVIICITGREHSSYIKRLKCMSICSILSPFIFTY